MSKQLQCDSFCGQVATQFVSDSDEQQPVWLRNAQTNPSTFIDAQSSAVGYSLPPVSEFPSSLSWDEGRWTGESGIQARIDIFKKTVSVFEKMGLTAPQELFSSNSYSEINDALVDMIEEYTLKYDGKLTYNDDSLLVELMDSNWTFHIASPEYIDSCGKYSELQKAFLYRAIGVFKSYNSPMDVGDYYEADYKEHKELQEEFPEDEQGMDLYQGTSFVGNDVVISHYDTMRDLEAKYAFIRYLNISPESITSDLASADLLDSFKQDVADFVTLSSRIGDFEDYNPPNEDDFFSDTIFSGCAFVVSPKIDNCFTDLLLTALEVDFQNVTEKPFAFTVDYKDVSSFVGVEVRQKDFEKFRSIFLKLFHADDE